MSRDSGKVYETWDAHQRHAVICPSLQPLPPPHFTAHRATPELRRDFKDYLQEGEKLKSSLTADKGYITIQIEGSRNHVLR